VVKKSEIFGVSEEIPAHEEIEKYSFSDIQKEILRWIAEGKSNSDISVIMNLSERNTRYHTDQILRKLDVSTRVQAAILYREGKIQFE
jgi:LuxR family transcriptional regulator